MWVNFEHLTVNEQRLPSVLTFQLGGIPSESILLCHNSTPLFWHLPVVALLESFSSTTSLSQAVGNRFDVCRHMFQMPTYCKTNFLRHYNLRNCMYNSTQCCVVDSGYDVITFVIACIIVHSFAVFIRVRTNRMTSMWWSHFSFGSPHNNIGNVNV